jgi:hypothetical protein
LKKQLVPLLVVALLFVFGSRGLSNNLKEIVINGSFDDFNIDSIPGKIPLGIIKINPIQPLFGEIPFSFELLRPKERSVQFQVGLIFPFPKKSFERRFFEESGENGEVSSNGLISYRKSPYNNYGLSFKFEFRKYGRHYYHGPQLMYKNCFYKNTIFSIYNGYQTESKFSNIIGFGYILGRQNDRMNIVFDWYGSVGFRFRVMLVNVLKIQDGLAFYPNSKKSISTFYPFINLGLRIGIKLWKNHPGMNAT